jgi:hypothetical protein
MTELGTAQASMSSAQGPEPANHGLLNWTLAPLVPSRNTPANDNPHDEDLPPCLPVTDEEVTLLHRYLSREILGLFS